MVEPFDPYAEAQDDLIVALDVPSSREAIEAVFELKDTVRRFKIGLELATAVGVPQIVHAIKEVNGDAEIMLDLKLHDIPNTMARAMKAARTLKVWGVTVHASADVGAIRACVDAAEGMPVIGVTVLTSLQRESCVRIYGAAPHTVVLAMAEILVEAGASHVVCSPQEVRELVDRDFGLIPITPGIRATNAPADDQARTMSTSEAIRAQKGGGHIVVGRPIMQPPQGVSRKHAALLVIEEMATAY